MYSTAEIQVLARGYLANTPGLKTSRLGLAICGNDRLIGRLLIGQDCCGRSALAASLWFDQNWPENLAWPLCGERGGTAHREAVAQRLNEEARRLGGRAG